LNIVDNQVKKFEEKQKGDGALINAGFFVLSTKVIERIEGDSTIWEQEPLRGLAHDGQLMSFKHSDFWQPMDTLRDKKYLEKLWQAGNAPWKIWK
jgi:glucose-1-phosphate cytidylyltransferase